MKIVSNAESFVDKLIPFLLKILALIKFVTVHLQRVLDKGVHIADWFELEVYIGLLLTDFFESSHDATKRVNILDFLINLKTNLFNVIS